MGEERRVLADVDRYRVMDPLFEGVRVALSYLGAPYSPDYVQGISGAAFRIGGICPCAPTSTATMKPQDLLKLFGYEVDYIPLYDAEHWLLEDGVPDVLVRIKDAIREGRPALLWHAFTVAEWDVVCGFDDATGKFLGRGSYAGLDGYAVADQMRTKTVVDTCPCIGAILIGDKVAAYDAGVAEVASLREAVAHATTEKDLAAADAGEWVFLEGLQCYDRWIRDFRADGLKVAGMGDRYCFSVYRSTHRSAAGFLEELAERYPDAATSLTEGADHFVREADHLNQCAEVLFPNWDLPQQATRETNDQVASWLQLARDHYGAGIGAIEDALQIISPESGEKGKGK